MEVLFGKVKDATGVAESHVSAAHSLCTLDQFLSTQTCYLKDTPFLLQLLPLMAKPSELSALAIMPSPSVHSSISGTDFFGMWAL